MGRVNELLKIIATAANIAFNEGYSTCTIRLHRYEWNNILDIPWHRNGIKIINDGDIRIRVTKLSNSHGVLNISTPGKLNKEIALPILYSEYIRIVVPASIKDELKEEQVEGIICEELRRK